MCKHQKNCPGLKGSKTDFNRVCNTCRLAFGNMKMTKKQQELIRTTIDKIIEKPLVEKAKVAFFPNANGNDYVAQCFEANDVLHAIQQAKKEFKLICMSLDEQKPKSTSYAKANHRFLRMMDNVFGKAN